MEKIFPFTMQEGVADLFLEDLWKLPVKKHLKRAKKKPSMDFSATTCGRQAES